MLKRRGRRRAQEEREELCDVVSLLNDVCRDGAILLVEGMSDAEALREAGISGQVVTLDRFRQAVVRGAISGTVVALLDLDREGEATMRRLKAMLEGRVTLDGSVRERLRATRRYKRGARTIQQLFAV